MLNIRKIPTLKYKAVLAIQYREINKHYKNVELEISLPINLFITNWIQI